MWQPAAAAKRVWRDKLPMAGQMTIIGDGLAACCLAHLLVRRGFSVYVRKTCAFKPARLLISEQTQSILNEIFGGSELFEGAQQIRRRMVSWGGKTETLNLPHRGLVVSESDLLGRLWRRMEIGDTASSSAATPHSTWTVVATSDHAALPAPQSFGGRRATVTSVALHRNAPEDCCWVESVTDGWLFLLPIGQSRAMLIGSGYVPEALIEKSTLIATQISNVDIEAGKARTFPAFPQILTAICGPSWLGCGSAVMRFDPLCGEGAGHAAREAMLAAAVLGAASRGEATADLLNHYSARLRQGFLRHLQACLPFYRTGGNSHFWKNEAASLERGIGWTQDRLRNSAPFQYRFAGYDLEPIARREAMP